MEKRAADDFREIDKNARKEDQTPEFDPAALEFGPGWAVM